jgi:ubiquinone/menaquinone biosynthesis C-methylase UbiE
MLQFITRLLPRKPAQAPESSPAPQAPPAPEATTVQAAPAENLNVYEAAVKRRCRQIALEFIPPPVAVESKEHEVWLEGLKDELNFWYLTVALDGWSWAGSYQLRLKAEYEFQFREFIDHFEDTHIRCLEVGTGAMAALGTRHPSKEIELFPTDALANAYNRIFQDFGVTTRFPVLQCDAEKLETKFEENFFHFAHASNCLDHCYNPVAAIQSMYRLVRPNGYVALGHLINVAESENYTGLHQWNLCPEDGKLAIWNKQQKIYVNDMLPPEAKYRIDVLPEQNWFTVYIQKAQT